MMFKPALRRHAGSLQSSADIKHPSAYRRQSLLGTIPLALFLVFISVIAGLSVIVFGYLSLIVIVVLVLLLALLYDFRIGVVALLIVYPLSATHMIPSYSGLNAQNLLLLGALVSYLLQRMWKQQPPYRLIEPRLLLFYVVPFVLAGLAGSQQYLHSQLTSPDTDPVGTPRGFILYFILKPGLLILLSLLIAAAVRESRRGQRFLTPYTIATLVPALLICGLFINGGASLPNLVTFRYFLPVLGLHANQFAVVLNFAIATTLFCGIGAPHGIRKWALLVTSALLSGVLLLTFSRGGYTGFAVILIAYFVYTRDISKLLIGLIILAAGAFFVPDAAVDRITLGVTHGSEDAMSSGRLTFWPPLLEKVLESPLWGHGFAYVGRSDLGQILAVGQAHNAYLDLLLDMGVIGMVLVVLFFAGVYRNFRSLSVTDPEPLFRGFFRGASVGLLAMLLQAFTDDHLTPNTPQLFFWMAYGLMLGRHPGMLKAAERESRTVGAEVSR